jgi:hypothetical protein
MLAPPVTTPVRGIDQRQHGKADDHCLQRLPNDMAVVDLNGQQNGCGNTAVLDQRQKRSSHPDLHVSPSGLIIGVASFCNDKEAARPGRGPWPRSLICRLSAMEKIE